MDKVCLCVCSNVIPMMSDENNKKVDPASSAKPWEEGYALKEVKPWSTTKLCLITFTPVALLLIGIFCVARSTTSYDGLIWLFWIMIFAAGLGLVSAVATGIHFGAKTQCSAVGYIGNVLMWFVIHCFLYFGVGFAGCSLAASVL